MILVLKLSDVLDILHDQKMLSSLESVKLGLVTMAGRLNLVHLSDALDALDWPPLEAPREKWRQFVTDLHQVVQEHRQIGLEWGLSHEQSAQLATYLAGSRLLFDCLQVAYVENRKAIENRLLLSPGDEDTKKLK